MSIYRNVVWYIKGLKEYTKAGYQAASGKFDPSDLNVDISGRSYMVTGANSGVGRIAALAIAKKGGTVHMVCRNKERGEAAQQQLQQDSMNTNIHLHIVDMSKPKEIVAFIKSFEQSEQPLHVLINNAGVLITGDQREVNEDGLEVTFATNSLGTHMLTMGLIPVLEKMEDPRIVTVSSGGMLVQKLDLSDLQFEKPAKFDGTLAYAQTKRQQVILTALYAEQHPNIHFSCMHPGWADTPGVRSSLPDFYEKMKDKLRSEEEGADTMVWLAVSKTTTTHQSGLFFQDRKPVPVHLPLAWTRSNKGDEKKLIDTLDDIARQYGMLSG